MRSSTATDIQSWADKGEKVIGTSIALIVALPELIAKAAQWLFSSDSLEWLIDFIVNFDSFLAQEIPRFLAIIEYAFNH